MPTPLLAYPYPYLHHHQHHRPTLPYEVWSTIFRFATSIEGSLSPNPDLFNHQRLQSRIHQSYVVKTTLRRVCRQWKESVTPLLFEYLCLYDQPGHCGFQWSLSQFAREIARENGGGGEGERKEKGGESEGKDKGEEKGVRKVKTSSFRGRWVRRIDVTISSRAGCLSLATILTHTTHLLVLNFTLNCPTAPRIPTPLLTSLNRHTIPTLHRISWQTGRNCALPASYFCACPKLKTLAIKLTGAGSVSVDEGCHVLEGVTALLMEGLNSEEREAILSGWELPLLERVSHGTSWSQALSIYIPNCCYTTPSSDSSSSSSPSPPHIPSYRRKAPPARQKAVSLHGIRWEEALLHPPSSPPSSSSSPQIQTWVGIRLRDVLNSYSTSTSYSTPTPGEANTDDPSSDPGDDADKILQARIRRFFDNLLRVEKTPDPDPGPNPSHTPTSHPLAPSSSHLSPHSIRVLDMGVEMVRKSHMALFADLATWCERAGIPFVDWDHRPFRVKHHSFTGTCVLNIKGHNRSA